MAYGARLESELGASPRGFESPILRKRELGQEAGLSLYSRFMASPRRSILLDLSPLRASPPFARLYLGNLVAGVGSQMTIVAVSLEVFDQTQSTFAVGLIGTVALVPAIVFGLYGGALADAFDRRRVGVVTALVTWSSTALIAAHSWFHWDVLWLLFVLTAVNSSATSVL